MMILNYIHCILSRVMWALHLLTWFKIERFVCLGMYIVLITVVYECCSKFGGVVSHKHGNEAVLQLGLAAPVEVFEDQE